MATATAKEPKAQPKTAEAEQGTQEQAEQKRSTYVVDNSVEGHIRRAMSRIQRAKARKDTEKSKADLEKDVKACRARLAEAKTADEQDEAMTDLTAAQKRLKNHGRGSQNFDKKIAEDCHYAKKLIDELCKDHPLNEE